MDMKNTEATHKRHNNPYRNADTCAKCASIIEAMQKK